jgi:hypothetical protein
MPIRVLPIQSNADAEPFDMRVVLDGRPFGLRFQWNERAACWHLSIAADDGEVLLRGIAIRNNCPLLRAARSEPRLPGGDIFAMADTEPGRDAERGELGQRVVLTYIEAAELP